MSPQDWEVLDRLEDERDIARSERYYEGRCIGAMGGTIHCQAVDSDTLAGVVSALQELALNGVGEIEIVIRQPVQSCEFDEF